GLEHGIEGAHLVDLDARDLQVVRHRVHDLAGEPAAVLVLGRAQGRQHGRAPPLRRKLLQPVIDLLAQVLGELHGGFAHRSISPNTMSRVAMMATTSASMWPRDISLMAARWAKPAERI